MKINSGIYKYGFGAQYAEHITGESEFLQLAFAYNELANCKPGSPATRNLSIAQGVQNTNSDKLYEIYRCSNWVVFVEPKIDLDFFIEQSDTGKDLIIIHYPDKNVTSSGYTSITVTQKSDQYIEDIKEYLESVDLMATDDVDIKRIIKNFNAYSGEWLMNFINGNQIDEKISLVSAINFCRKYFKKLYPDYVWVPIALDEVLRVTGSIGGTLTNVLFSKKVLISRGIIESQNATSDDLLMAGIKNIGNEVYVTYIPVEVKHRKCSPEIRKDAHSQVCNTAYLLRKSFLNPDSTETKGTKVIDRKIYRNYMVQHVISNAEKMLAYKIVEKESDYSKIIDSDVRIKLLNDLYTLELGTATDAYTFYFVEGQRAVLKSQNSQDQVIEISVPIAMMYEFLIDGEKVDQEIEALHEAKLQLDQTVYEINVPSEEDEIELDDQDDYEGDRESETLELEMFKMKDEKESEQSVQIEGEKNSGDVRCGKNEESEQSVQIKGEKNSGDVKCGKNEENVQKAEKMNVDDAAGKVKEDVRTLKQGDIDTTQSDKRIAEKVQITGKETLSRIRVLVGNDTANNKIYWEFGNKNLANRHLLITGTSGQGKTYSIQTMLYELSTTGISSVIFDYTEGFMKTQLEKAFIDKMDNKIKEHIIYSTGVPINPFVQHEIEIGGVKVQEKPADVAARLADILTHVYDFGDQQYAAIFTAALNGIKAYGDHMNMQIFQNQLEDIQGSNKAAKTVLSKMEPFFHTITFEENSLFDWKDILYGAESSVNIFQLTLINREMQVIITELMLWDAWYYTKKYGNKEKPFIVVLDEAQNLSHKLGSPSAVILTEGRKFGWSAWFATQSLKILKDEEVVRLLQVAFKMYFKPTGEEVVKIAKQLDPTGENNWTSEVKNLKKGTCIVVGDRIKADGTFGGTQPTVVSVETFEKRIK